MTQGLLVVRSGLGEGRYVTRSVTKEERLRIFVGVLLIAGLSTLCLTKLSVLGNFTVFVVSALCPATAIRMTPIIPGVPPFQFTIGWLWG